MSPLTENVRSHAPVYTVSNVVPHAISNRFLRWVYSERLYVWPFREQLCSWAPYRFLREKARDYWWTAINRDLLPGVRNVAELWFRNFIEVRKGSRVADRRKYSLSAAEKACRCI